MASTMELGTTRPRDGIIAIELPEDGSSPIRKIISRSNARITGKYPSWKMNRMVHWRSRDQLNSYRLLDSHPAVISFHEQPLLIHMSLNGVMYPHYPDVLVELSNSRELWSIRTNSDAQTLETLAFARLLQNELPRFGFTHRLVTSETLAGEPRLSTAIMLLRHGRQPVTLTEREHVRHILEKVGFITWEAAQTGLLGLRGRAILARLALEGILQLHPDARLAPQTRFIPAPNSSQGSAKWALPDSAQAHS